MLSEVSEVSEVSEQRVRTPWPGVRRAIRLRNVKGHSGWPCEQVRDTCLVAGGGSEGDELLVGVIGDLEHDVVQVELAESRVT